MVGGNGTAPAADQRLEVETMNQVAAMEAI